MNLQQSAQAFPRGPNTEILVLQDGQSLYPYHGPGGQSVILSPSQAGTIQGTGTQLILSPQGGALSYIPQDRLVAPKKPNKRRPGYRRGLSCVLGVIHICLGAINIGIQSAAMLHSVGTVASGIWCGVMFMLAGLAGIVAGIKRHADFIVLFLLSSVLCGVIFSPVVLIVTSIELRSLYSGVQPFYGRYWDIIANRKAQVSMASLELVVCVISIVVAVVGLKSRHPNNDGEEISPVEERQHPTVQYINSPVPVQTITQTVQHVQHVQPVQTVPLQATNTIQPMAQPIFTPQGVVDDGLPKYDDVAHIR